MNGLVNVIRAELFKALRKKRTYVMAGLLWLIFPPLMLLVGWILQTRVADTFVEDVTSVREVIQIIASPIAITRNGLLLFGNLSPSLLIIVVALIAALLIGEERNQNMWKTVLTTQTNRLTVLSGKLLTAMILLGLLFLGSYLVGPVFGGLGMSFLPTSFGSGWLELLGLYSLQWLFAFAAMLFAFLIIWLLRSLPLGIVTIFFLPALLEGIITFYRTVVGFDRLNRFNAFLEILQLRNTFESLPKYFFTSNLYAPSRQPLSKLTDILDIDVNTVDAGPFASLFSLDLSRSAWVMLVYAIIFAVLLAWSFSRRDIN